MRSPRVLVLYNEPTLPDDHPHAESEHDVLYTADMVSRALIQAGYSVTRLGVDTDPDALLGGLRAAGPDVVFNLFEGTPDDGDSEAHVTGMLEWLGLPFTGSPSPAMWLARGKDQTKRLLRGAGLPTAEFFAVDDGPVPKNRLGWPVIVKPAREDASVGIEQASVVTDQAALEARVEYVRGRFGPPVLVERFIDGREFNVALVELPELRVLPFSEILFVDREPGYWPLVTYDAKWRPGTRDFIATPPRHPRDLDPDLEAAVEAAARAAYRLIGCRDYARVDFRVDAAGKPYILEVNPNPCISTSAGLASALAASGRTHAWFVLELVRAALARAGSAEDQPADLSAAPKKSRGRGRSGWAVRPVRAADREAVAGVLAGCGPFAREWPEDTLERVMAEADKGRRAAAPCLVVHERGRVGGVACARAAERAPGVFALEALAVGADWQGRGLGRRLLTALEEQLRRTKARLLLAEVTSDPAGAVARQFLLRHGFRQVGDLPEYYPSGYARLTFARHLIEEEVPSTTPADAATAAG